MSQKKIIGIDLGTTNSCVAVMEGGKPVVIPNSEGSRTTPSVVAYTKNGDRLVGDPAKRQAITNPDRTVTSIKREMGTDYRITIDKKKYTPEELSAQILVKLKKDAESYLGTTVTDAVITVPAYFNDMQRQATKDAGRIAGLNVQRIINEPTAAALAYGLDNAETRRIMVYDLGGGTFDVSIIEIQDGVIRVLATAGNNHLGGDDFDERIAGWILREVQSSHGLDLSKDSMAMQRIRQEAEKAKKELSSATQTQVSLPFLAQSKTGAIHFEETLTRAHFEGMISDLIDETAAPVQNTLRDAGLLAKDLDKVLLVGGSTRVPAVQNKVRQLIGQEASRNLNPDECVALGAAVQGGKLAGDSTLNEILLMDVTPLSLSIETYGGIATRLIERNSTIPTRYSRVFSTAANFQTSVEIKVLQGERRFAKDNKLIGNFRLKGIKAAMRGVPQIEVTFDIDANGILNVSARDLGTGREQKVTITSNSRLSEDEIARAMNDASVFESQDMDAAARVETWQEAERLADEAQAYLASQKKTLDRERKSLLKNAVAKTRRDLRKIRQDNIRCEDVHRLKEDIQELKSAMGKA